MQYVIKAREYKKDKMQFDVYTITSADGKHKYSLGINDVDTKVIKAPCAVVVEIDPNKLSTSKRLVEKTGQIITKIYVNMKDIKIAENQELIAKLNAEEINNLFN